MPLRARTHGVQPQIWSVDGRYRVTVEPNAVGGAFTWHHVVTLPLSSGQHKVRALVPGLFRRGVKRTALG